MDPKDFFRMLEGAKDRLDFALDDLREMRRTAVDLGMTEEIDMCEMDDRLSNAMENVAHAALALAELNNPKPA